jgi:hypothetical protein
VQNSLVRAILKFNWDGYPTMRARIFLRKKSRAVNDTSVQAELDKFKTRAKCHYTELTEADVLDALVRGDEVRYLPRRLTGIFMCLLTFSLNRQSVYF